MNMVTFFRIHAVCTVPSTRYGLLSAKATLYVCITKFLLLADYCTDCRNWMHKKGNLRTHEVGFQGIHAVSYDTVKPFVRDHFLETLFYNS